MWLFGFLMGLAGGGAAVWFGKDSLVKWYLGAEAFEKSLEAKIADIKIKLGVK